MHYLNFKLGLKEQTLFFLNRLKRQYFDERSQALHGRS